MATQANPEFVEALCGAWVRGWYAGIDGIKNDDGKRSAAAEIAADSRFASLNAAPDLRAALKAVAVSPGRPLNDGGCSRMLTPETATMVAAALAKAQAEA